MAKLVLNLREAQEVTIDQLFFGFIDESLSEVDIATYLQTISKDDENYNVVKKIDDHISNLVLKNGLDNSEADHFADIIKRSSFLKLKKTEPTIIMKYRGAHINMADNHLIDLSKKSIKHMEPISDYYTPSEFRFIETDGKIQIDFDSIEPYEAYVEKHKN